MDGAEGYIFLSTLTFINPSTTPGLSKSACRLNYWFYQPRFPSPVLVPSQIWALPYNFPSCPRTVSWLGCVAPLAGTTHCRFSIYGTPGPCDCLRAYQLPKTWGVPSMATPPRCSRGRLAPRAPSPGARAHDTAHVANGAPGPASCGPTRAHYTIPAPHGPLAYHSRLTLCPGYPLSDTHRS